MNINDVFVNQGSILRTGNTSTVTRIENHAPTRIVGGSIELTPSDNASNVHWHIHLDSSTTSSNTSDLVLKSRNNTTITFTDDFQAEVLNFTGKHRCCFSGHLSKDMRGRIVSSLGRYMNLDGDSNIVSMDEAVPVVALCNRAYDPTIFGIIHDIDMTKGVHQYQIGNMKFARLKENAGGSRVIVNSHGEGGILVCDKNGHVQNGDLLTSSGIQGLAMRQGDDIVRAYTVCKTTCSCDFSDVNKVFIITHKHRKIKVQLIGCIYKI